MYGIGPNASRHWAGPFLCYLWNFNYFASENGTDLAEFTVVPSLIQQAQLSLQPIDREHFLPWGLPRGMPRVANKVMSHAIQTDPLYSISMGGVGIQVPIGSVFVRKKDMGNLPRWNVTTKDLIEGVRKLYTNYAHEWGMPNFLFFISQQFEDTINKFLSSQPVIPFVVDIAIPPALHEMKTFLNRFGINLKIITKERRREGVPPSSRMIPLGGDPAKAVSPTKPTTVTGHNFKLILDINETIKLSNNFFDAFDSFYGGFLGKDGTSIKPSFWAENNLTVLRYIKDYGTGEIKKILTNDNEPLLVVGDKNTIREQVYGFKGMSLSLAPLPEEDVGGDYKERISHYYLNKVSHKFNRDYFLDLDQPSNDMTYKEPVTSVPEEDIIMFEANTPQSNILSYNFDANLFTLAALQRQLGEVDASPDEVEKFIEQNLKNFHQNAGLFDIASVAKALREFIRKERSITKPGRGLTVPKKKSWKASVGTFTNFVDRLAIQIGVTGTLKTLPMFQLSDRRMIGTQCEINIKKNPAFNDYPIQKDLQDTFYNGRYLITGFKHHVSPTDAYSEFSILKIGLPKKYKSKAVV